MDFVGSPALQNYNYNLRWRGRQRGFLQSKSKSIGGLSTNIMH